MQTNSSAATSTNSSQNDVVAGEREPHKLTKESDVQLGTKKHAALAENNVPFDQLEGPDSFNNICDEGASTSGIMSPSTTSKEIQKHVLSVTTDSRGDFGSLMPNDLQYDQVRKHGSLQDTIPICHEAKPSTSGISGLITSTHVEKKFVDYNVASDSVSEYESLDSELSGNETARLANMTKRMDNATKEVEGKSRKQRRVKTCPGVRNAHECDEENCNTCANNVAKTVQSQIYFSKTDKGPTSQRETAFSWQHLQILQQENQQLRNQRDGRIESALLLRHTEAEKKYIKQGKSLLDLKEKNKEQQAAMEALRTQLATVISERDAFKAELTTVKAKLAKTKDKLTKEREVGIRELPAVKAELDTTKGELVLVKAARDAAKGELVIVKPERDSAKCELAAVKTERDAAKGELVMVKAARDAATGELVTVKADRNSAKCELAKVKTELDAAKGELVTVKARGDSATGELASVKAERDAAKTELASVKAERDAAKNEVASVKAERDVANAQRDDARNERDNLSAELEATNTQWEEQDAAARAQYNDLRAYCSLLQQRLAQYRQQEQNGDTLNDELRNIVYGLRPNNRQSNG